MHTPRTITLKDCPKAFTTDQDKAVSPAETLQYFYQQVEAMDIKFLNEVKRIDNGRLDIPVFFSVCGEDVTRLTGAKKQMGKGASPVQAEASACMELAERFSFFSFKQEAANFIEGDYRQMIEVGYNVLPIEALLKSVDDQTTPAEIAEKVMEDIPMQWVWARNLTSDQEVLIPFSWFYAINEYNGSSAGNTVEEAALQGICEVVERHVCSRITHEKLSTPKIDIDSITDKVAVELIEKFRKNNIELYVNDFSLDTGICTVGALAIDRSTFPESSEIVYTAGTTPDPEKAFIRTITEIAQLAGDFNTDSNYEASGLPKPLNMEDMEYVTKTHATVSIENVCNLSDDNFRTEVMNCVNALERIGLDVFVVDITHPKLKIPALYTIVPGAHFRERSVSKNMGLFAAKLADERIDNPMLLETKLEQLQELLPSAYFVEFYRGRNLYNMGLAEQALTYFEKALSLDPQEEDLPFIYSYKGHALQAVGEYDQAIETLNLAREYDNERPDLHNMLGVCYFKKEQYADAITCFEKAVELDPSSAMDYANLGVNHNRLGQKEEAIHFFNIALSLDPDLDFVREQLDALTRKKT